jgi:hypothetical protein
MPGPADVDDLDPVLAQHRVGGDVPLVPHDHARGDGEEVGAVVPLLALGRPDVLVRAEHHDLGHLQDLGQRVPQAVVAGDRQFVRLVARADRPAPEVPVEVGVEDEGADVHHRHHRVEVHEGMAMRQLDGHDPGGLAVVEKSVGHRLDRHRRCPFAHADQDRPMTDDMDVAALDRRRLVRLVLAPVVGHEVVPGE